jgi:F-type H+-transporting ATPase subunit epsilon
MNAIQTNILTPFGPVFKGLALGVNLPGTEGGFEIKYNHASLMSVLDIGKIVIRKPDGGDEIFTVSGGFVEVHKNVVTILAESAERKDDIDVSRAQRARERVEELGMEQIRKDISAEMALKRAINRIRVAEL